MIRNIVLKSPGTRNLNVCGFWETGRQNTQMALFPDVFTFLIMNFSIQQIKKMAVPNYTLKQFNKVRRISDELLVKSKLK